MKSLALMFIAALAAATPAAAAQYAPHCSTEKHRQFDFWVGDWDVFTPDGQRAGRNVITVEEYGCLLVERWTNEAGQTGQSYTFVDLSSGTWRQVWVSAGATIDYAGGLNAEGAMVLEGTIGYPAGPGGRFRGTWTRLDNGDVRQHFEQQDAASGAWSDWFVGVYKRRAASAD